jgi:ACS family glucarate transporter-like MFS transporter
MMPQPPPWMRVRWWIFLFMFAFALMSFVQRTSIAVASETFMPTLHITQVQLGLLNTTFLIAYTIMQVPGGIIGQRFGARLTYIGVGVLGISATLATPALPALYSGAALFLALLIAQLVLGVALAPVFPVFASVVEAWFPKNRWAIANGLQSSGMLLGGAVTPILVVSLTHAIGWQGALLCIAIPVAFLTLGWGWYGRSTPAQHPSVTAAELAELDSGGGERVRPLTLRRLRGIVADRNVVLLSVSYLCMNYTFYLLTYWSFLYLVQVRHFTGIESGFAGMVPWIGAALGAAAGGLLSDRLAERLGARWGYRMVPLIALPAVGALLLLTIAVSKPYAAVLALAAAFGAVEINEGAYWAATMRVARADTGAATGVLNTGGNLGGILCQPIVAALSAAGAWNLAFATGSALALVAAGAWLFIDADRHSGQLGPQRPERPLPTESLSV